LHELCHALGFVNISHQEIDGTTQMAGQKVNQEYKKIIDSKYGNHTFYADTAPAQGSDDDSVGHFAEYAKEVNGKIQPAILNELMSPAYGSSEYREGFERLVLSRLTLAVLDDFGYNVDYDQAEGDFLLKFNTEPIVDVDDSRFDQLNIEKSIRRCICGKKH